MSSTRKIPRLLQAVLALIVLALAYGAKYAYDHYLGGPGAGSGPVVVSDQHGTATGGDQLIIDAFHAGESGVVVESAGEVIRSLPDDLEGSAHQRFIVRLAGGHTLLVSHNIDLAPRVPLDEGETVAFRGQYEWSERGGVIHWTHHDPGGRRPGGWIEHGGKRYR